MKKVVFEKTQNKDEIYYSRCDFDDEVFYVANIDNELIFILNYIPTIGSDYGWMDLKDSMIMQNWQPTVSNSIEWLRNDYIECDVTIYKCESFTEFMDLIYNMSRNLKI